MTVAVEPPIEVPLDGLTHSQRLRLLDTWPVIAARYPEEPAMRLAAYRGARQYIAGDLSTTSAGGALATARGHEKLAIAAACQIAIMAVGDGRPESHIAAELGVDRMTVRKWVGK